jgi:hypothetical protein
MYRFSRSIYRELAPRVEAEDPTPSAEDRLLKACESNIHRLASDTRYFAKPAKTLFTEVRDEFALADQVYVYMVIERYINLALEHLERLPDGVSLSGVPRSCHASTRQGTPCRREPLPGRDYCPSHKHLEESEVEAEAARADRVSLAA